jgi:hypothetical protein
MRFIHIPKCGGTFIKRAFRLKQFHITKPKHDPKFTYVIWLRNPFRRFVSMFNFCYSIVTTDVNKLRGKQLNVNNSLAPAALRRRRRGGCLFTPELDELYRFFKTPNYLAESLGTENSLLKEKIKKIMNPPTWQHKGIGWYLNNGDFIHKYNSQILFVGTVENMEKDVNNLSLKLQVKCPRVRVMRKNKNKNISTYLSPKAISNLTLYFQETDFKALTALKEYGLINETLLTSYKKYKN